MYIVIKNKRNEYNDLGKKKTTVEADNKDIQKQIKDATAAIYYQTTTKLEGVSVCEKAMDNAEDEYKTATQSLVSHGKGEKYPGDL